MACGLAAALWLALGASPAAAQAGTPVVIVITGVSGDIRDDLLDSLSLQRERGHPLLTELRIERLHRLASDEIRRGLQPFGYYRATVDSELKQVDGTWRAAYRVALGPPVRVTTVDLRIEGPGAEDDELQRWREEFPLRQGDILLHRVYENARDELLQIARGRGFLEGDLITHQVRVSVERASAEIELVFQSGPRYRFGATTFSEVPLQEDLLQRFPDYHRGDYYDAEQVFRLHRDLTNSDYFDRIEVVPRVDDTADLRVPVEVTVEMRKRDRYSMGIGYGTDTGPRVTVGMQRRWVNEHGHRFGGEVLASEVRTGAAVYYRIPLARPNTDFLSITGGREHEDTNTSVRDTSTLGLSITRVLSNNWVRTAALNYQDETFEVADVVDRSTMLYPNLSFQRVEADDRLFPLRGWRAILEARAASEEVSSTTNLLQGRLAAKGVHALLGGRGIVRFDVATSYVTDFDEVPVSLRFFAGGDQSVRGFTYQSLGPENAEGEVVGGQHLLVGSIEYDTYFSERWGAAVFTDVGNAFNSFDDYTLHQGTGAGVRLRLPFGLIRLDLAWAVSEEDKPWRLHLSIGPDL
ncbi:MAG: autotransporter assembly complex family protein [Thiohalomonadaceae bacterium]